MASITDLRIAALGGPLTGYSITDLEARVLGNDPTSDFVGMRQLQLL